MNAALLGVSASLLLVQLTQCAERRSLVVDHTRAIFLKDGEPFRFVAGEMHYFRVPKAYWKDRLYKIKMAGLNTVSFYIEWSGHEPEPQVYNFDDEYDLDTFLKEIKNQGLLAIVRPGPYICAERDNGGLPYWLLREHPGMVYRSADKNFLDAVQRWFAKLLPILVPHLYANGGPIFAAQVENEYGHYKLCDLEYMERLLTIMESYMGKDVVYFRADFPYLIYYDCDKVRDILVAGNVLEQTPVHFHFRTMRIANPKPAPSVVSEYYTGWMDYWGYSHNAKKKRVILNNFEVMTFFNASVAFYMFVGGTNFGFKAATSTTYPLTTSYDYGAPVSEGGEVRSLYYEIRKLATKYLGHVPQGEMPRSTPKLYLGAVQLSRYVSLEDVLDHFRSQGRLKQKQSLQPLTFEQMSHDSGFLVYRTTVSVVTNGMAALYMSGLRDRAYVRAGGKLFVFYNHSVSFSRKKTWDMIPVNKGDNLSILVENMGREDYGKGNHDPKGLTEVFLGARRPDKWTIEAVPINNKKDVSEILRITQQGGTGTTPGFFHGTFTLKKGQEPADTFLDPSGWIKGFAFINGINLGRYWPVTGPQVTLYLPGVYLRPHPEENQLLLFETEEAPPNRTVTLVNKPYLDADILFPRP